MRSLNLKSIVTLSALLSPVCAVAHGPVMQITVDDNKITTRDLFIRPNVVLSVDRYDTLQNVMRLYQLPMAQNTTATNSTDQGWYGQVSPDSNANFLGPGFAYGHHGFNSSVNITVSFSDTLKLWNGSSFVDPGTAQFQGLNSSNFTTATKIATSDSTSSFQGVAFNTGAAALDDTKHKQFYWRLLGDGVSANTASPDGVYLVQYTLTTDQPGVAASDPYYILFSKNASPTEESDAFVAATALVPEPGSLGVVGLAGLLLGRRRRA